MLTREAVVQIHPSRLCNYQCVHCYSSSGPKVAPALDVRDILRTTQALAARGYTRAALSGGEPVLYPDFPKLVAGLADQGFSVSVITNGSRPVPLLAACDAGHVHHAAVSFDGLAPLHDHIRKKPGAYVAAINTVKSLRASGYSCGAVLSVTQKSMPQLPETISDVIRAGATHVQLHPLASVGRARDNADDIGQELPAEALLRMLVLNEVLRARHPEVAFQCDVIAGTWLSQKVVQDDTLISPLVLCDDGAIVPYAYDFSRAHTLGHVGDTNFSTTIGTALAPLLKHTTQRLSDVVATSFYRELVFDSQDTSQIPT